MTTAFRDRLQSFSPALARELHERLLDEADEIATLARQRAPYKTGTLRRSISSGTDRENMVIVKAQAPYARRIEYGFIGQDSRGRNYHQSARPYLRPAIDERMGPVRQTVREAMRDAAASHFGRFITR
jgi:hypothetical protein